MDQARHLISIVDEEDPRISNSSRTSTTYGRVPAIGAKGAAINIRTLEEKEEALEREYGFLDVPNFKQAFTHEAGHLFGLGHEGK